jgi:hypothetical protein
MEPSTKPLMPEQESVKKPHFLESEKADIVVATDNFVQEIVVEKNLHQKGRQRSPLETGCRGEGYD